MERGKEKKNRGKEIKKERRGVIWRRGKMRKVWLRST
jgi:hypothetical protein